MAAEALFKRVGWLGLLFCLGATVRADSVLNSKPSKNDKSPSRDQVLWTETDVGYDFLTEYSYAGRGQADFGHGTSGGISEHYVDLRQVGTLRMFLAFLVYEGVEWQHYNYDPDPKLPVPAHLDSLNAFLATDFRWSSKDMLRVQFEPGVFTDWRDVDGHDINVPIALAYTRIPSRRFQWAIGLSINTWRASRYLPGGGFRWYINDRWKLNAMLPTPMIEYKAGPALHVSVGADFRGDVYRVSRTFGDGHGDPRLNDALLEMQEIRCGAGFSWNIKPLIELNGQAGYLFSRSFDYRGPGIHSSGGAAPYVSLNVRMLFQLIKDTRPMPAQIRSMEYKLSILQNVFNLGS